METYEKARNMRAFFRQLTYVEPNRSLSFANVRVRVYVDVSVTSDLPNRIRVRDFLRALYRRNIPMESRE